MIEYFQKFDWPNLFAGLVGALVAMGFLKPNSLRHAFAIFMSGLATNVYVAPLAMFYFGFPPGHPLSLTIGFFAGLLGMKVIALIMEWSDGTKDPRDFLNPFKPPPQQPPQE